MEIQYETYGIPHDCEKKKLIINSVSDLYIVYQGNIKLICIFFDLFKLVYLI